VNGTTTTINTANLDVSDNIIMLSKGTTTPANDAGILIERGANRAFMGWDNSESKFTMGLTDASSNATGDLTINFIEASLGFAVDSADEIILSGKFVDM
jgi:hypothetical protein